jgi:GT2 family glycosyltransferase
MSQTKFSLIMGVLGRTDDLQIALARLAAQSHREFELIVVDQNADERLSPVLAPYAQTLTIRHVRSELPGLSRARSMGLQHATGQLIAFPDDDARYPVDFLTRLEAIFRQQPDWDGIIGRITPSELLNSEVADPPDGASPRAVSSYTAFRYSNSNALFFRRALVQAVGGFDETLGVGSGTPWGAAEEVDYVLRALLAGFRVVYHPGVIVGHPVRPGDRTPYFEQRAYGYAAGGGRVLRKHGLPLWYVAYQSARSLQEAGKAILHGHQGGAWYHWTSFRARLWGWRHAVRPAASVGVQKTSGEQAHRRLTET